MPNPNFFWNETTTGQSSAIVASGLGHRARELWWSSLLDKSPLWFEMAGRPKDIDGAMRLAKDGLAPGIMMYDGGPAINERMVYQTGNTPTWLSGYDTFDYEGSDEIRHFQYRPRWGVLPVAMSLDEREANRHKGRWFELASEKVDIAYEVFDEDIGDNLINSDGTDSGGKKMMGLAAIIRSDPTASFSLGGWDFSANSNIRNKYNGDLTGSVTAGAAGDFTQVGRYYVRNQYNNVYARVGAKRTKAMVCSQNVWELWMEALESRDIVVYQGTGGMTGGGRGAPGGERIAGDGYTTIRYNGATVMWDPHMPNGTATGYNNMILFLTFGPFRLAINSRYFFKARPWTPHKGQLADSMEIIMSCTCVAGAPSQLGIIDGFDNP